MLRDVDVARIASEWHGGMFTALYSLASTGAIHTPESDITGWERDTIAEIRECLDEIEAHPNANPPNDYDTDKADLTALLEYVTFHGVRGEVSGWGDLNW